jgi:hypothetical protein
VDNQSFPSGEPSHEPSHLILAYQIIVSPAAYPLAIGHGIITGLMQPFSFLLLIASLAFALPAKSAEHKLLTSDDFGKTIAKGYW